MAATTWRYLLRPDAIFPMSPRVHLESSRGQFWKNCRNRVRGAVLEGPPNLPARCFWHTRQARCRHVSDLPPDPLRLGRRRRIPAVGFSRATNKLHAVPPWRQEWIARGPAVAQASGPPFSTAQSSGRASNATAWSLSSLPPQRRRMVHQHVPRSCQTILLPPRHLCTCTPQTKN